MSPKGPGLSISKYLRSNFALFPATLHRINFGSTATGRCSLSVAGIVHHNTELNATSPYTGINLLPCPGDIFVRNPATLAGSNCAGQELRSRIGILLVKTDLISNCCSYLY